MMIPNPPSSKPVALYDTESFVNYWLLKIRIINGPVYTFRLEFGQSFDGGTRERIWSLFDLFTVVSFNGIYYDVPIISAALAGWSCEQLKWLSDQIIIQQLKPWELSIPEWKPRDHIDLIEVAPGAGSQKQYAGRIHCKTMRDCPYEPDRTLSPAEMLEVDSYCENDLFVLGDLFNALQPQLHQREELSKRYGIDLRSKSDAQVAEAVIKHRCEQALGQRIYKPDIDWNIRFRYEPPAFLSFQDEQLKRIFELIKSSIFALGGAGAVEMPKALQDAEISLGRSVYRIGIGGLHSSEKRAVHRSDDQYVLRDLDVASYYPRLILNSGKYPPALGPVFREIYEAIINERLQAKDLEKKLKKFGNTKDPNYIEGFTAHCENEGGKIMINGTFGKTGSHYSILFAPEMMIQTTVTGQLSLLMLIEWLEMQGISVVSANTDGVLIKCRRDQIATVDLIVKHWQERTGLEMEATEYRAVYSRDVNNYFAVYTPEEAAKQGMQSKRKGEYSRAGLVEKKNPDVEICGDAVEKLLADGIPLLYTIAECKDIRKFVTIQKVSGGAVKLWGEGPDKGTLIRDMTSTLIANGWEKQGRQWRKVDPRFTTPDGSMRAWEITDARTAYSTCFLPQRPEYLGKVIRWYYGTNSPGSIIYNSNGNTVGNSYGAHPCMVLPDEFPRNIDYSWYLSNAEKMLKQIGYYD